MIKDTKEIIRDILIRSGRDPDDYKKPTLWRTPPQDLETHKINIGISKSGIPCLFERGGAYTKSGYARIICTPTGNPKRPIFIKTTGPRACSDHALLTIKEGTIVVEATQSGLHSDDATIVYISTYVIKEISLDDRTATLEPFLYCGKEDPLLAAALLCLEYHARNPIYIREKLPTKAVISKHTQKNPGEPC